MRATIVDRLVVLVEAYAQGRDAEKTMRREMRAKACLRAAGRDGVRCYLPIAGIPDENRCEPCKARSFVWRAFRQQKADNRALLGRIERLALKLSMPDPVEPEEPKPLLEMMGVTDGEP